MKVGYSVELILVQLITENKVLNLLVTTLYSAILKKFTICWILSNKS